MTCGIAIPAFRNPDGLRRCLLSIAQRSSALAERVTVVDDSGDGHVRAALEGDFPHVKWIVHRQNAGFIAAANAAMRACDCELVILLNDDVALAMDPVPVIAQAFADPKLFALTFQSTHADGSFREGAKRLVWPFGIPRVLHNARDQHPTANGNHPSDYAVGGHAAFRRLAFLQLGGFDSLFHPFYWEDVDLGLRARQKGWSIIYHPDCRVIHAGASAIRTTYQANQIREITERNRLLFAWRHLPRSLRSVHRIALAARRLSARLTADSVYLAAACKAAARQAEYSAPDRLTQSNT